MDRLEYSHDGSRLAAATGNGDTWCGTRRRAPLVHRFVEGGRVWALDFSADDRTLYSGRRIVTSWDLTGERELFSVGKASDLADYTVSNPGSRRAHPGAGAARPDVVRRQQTGRKTAKRPERRRPTTYHVWSPDSRRLLSWRDAGNPSAMGDGHGAARRATPALRRRRPGLQPIGRPGVRQRSSRRTSCSSWTRATLRAAACRRSSWRRSVLGVVPHPARRVGVRLRATTVAVLRVDTRHRRRRRRGVTRHVPARAGMEAELSPDGTRLLGPEPQRGRRRGAAGRRHHLGAVRRPPHPGTRASAPSTCRRTAPSSPRRTTTRSRSSTQPPAPARPRSRCRCLRPEARITYLPDSSGLLVAGIEGSTWTVDTRLDSWVDRACTIAGRNLSHEEWKEYFPDRAYEVTCPQWPTDG